MKYVGTLGEVRHFKIKGNTGYYAGLKGGPTAEQVKTAPGLCVLVKTCLNLQHVQWQESLLELLYQL
jgi:hypothetical protein